MKILNVNIITLFPEFFVSAIQTGLLGKAVQEKLIHFNFIQLRHYAVNRHGQVDDAPYGGGHGMVLMIEPVVRALDSIQEATHTVLLTPRGYLWNQKKCTCLFQELQRASRSLTLICGHYEGFDERIVNLVDESIRIGDYVLSGGESAALILIDSMSRLMPGFMGNPESLKEESFYEPRFIEYPQYTRPAEYRGWGVPDVLLSGDHGKIEKWRAEEAVRAHNKFSGQAKTDDEKQGLQ
ncbi:MAG: tRNA (guanosine(37)-N1)-methyltransferase TrmD [Spirochaetia bacterium]|nr:tRNA (guanosine(37)-N1)-methyltransferase TrmD [Spirochaetia bacterium]